ncbi:MAG: tetratricopeptide repeat protein, partial [Myxococcota bacterium]|nr:tetratricopeptide repeat protein [Myxococcota bacterium]
MGPNENTSGANNAQNPLEPRRILHELSERRQGEFAAVVASLEREVEERILEHSEEKTVTLTVYHALDDDHDYDAEPPEEERDDGRHAAIGGSEKPVARVGPSGGGDQDQVIEEEGRRPLFSGGTSLGGLNRSQLDSVDRERPSLASLVEILPDELEVPEERLSGEWSALPDGVMLTKPDGMPGAVQFLGSLPHLRGAPPTDGLPVGSMHYALPSVKSDEVIEAPSIARLENEGDGWADRFLRFLWSEMSRETDVERMAALLYAAGRIIAVFKGGAQDASPIFWAACANAPDAHHCRWALHESLRSSGQHKALIARWLEESSSRGEIHGYRHGAGYLALERGMTPTEAQAIWDESGDRTELLLSKFLLHSARFEWEDALDLVRKASAQAEGSDLWGLFAFTRVRLSMELDDVPQVRALLQRMIDLLGHTPGVSAFVFQSAVELDDLELQLRLGQVNVDFLKEASAGTSPDDESELAKALVQLGWVLERLGRHAEALTFFEKALRFNGLGGRYVQRRCVELAQYLGDPHRVRTFMEAAAEGVSSDEERANAYYQMGLVARERLADEALAAQDFRKALSALPSFTPAQRALCRLENRAGRFEEAESSLTRETDALAERLADEQADEGTRRRLYDSLERKYFRLGRMLEERGALEEAVAVYKRAHDLSPDALPPFFALDRIYAHLGLWRPRVELLLKWADATSDDGEAVAQILMEAADGARVHLADPKRAWGLYFRVINGGTPNDYTLWRAGTVLSDFNDHSTRLELEVARARHAGGGWGEHFWRAGVLKERDVAEGAPVEAGALYLEGLERAPDHCGLIDGFVRTQASYRSGPALIRSLKQIPAELCESGALSIFLAEHYLAAGAPKEAAELLLHWRARARSRGSSDAQIDLGIAQGLEIAFEDLNDWPALADLMEEQALETGGEGQVERLVRAGLYWEQSLGEHGLARELYGRALALEPGDPIARAALRRLATPDESFLDGAHSFLAPKHLSQLKAIARGIAPYDGDIKDECGLGHHALSSGAELLWGTGTEARDIAERRLLSESGRLDRKADYERLKLKYGSGQKERELLKSTSDAGERESIAHSLRQQIGLGFRSGDNRMVREAAERLLVLTPNSVPALMALRRLTRASGDRQGLQENTSRLLDVTRSKEAAAELRHAALIDAQARGASEEEISKLLEEAVLLDPTNGSLAKALEEKLRSESKWSELLGLYDRMLAHLPSPKDRQRILRARGEVLSEEFGDHGEALAGLDKEFEENEPELASALLAARLCERLGRFDAADTYFEQATVTSNESERMEAVRAHCRALFARGETKRSLELIDTILQSEPENVEAWEMVAEILGMRKDWKGVVKALRRLLSYETNDAKKAQRAAAIAEVFAQVFGDARRAAGWYKRAVELAPGELSHLKRLKEQLARIDEDPLAEVHMTDAVERAIAAQREKLRHSPVDVSSLSALFELYGLSGQADGELVCGQLLSWLGSSNPKMRTRIEFLGARVRSDSPIGLTPDLRARIVSPDEKGTWARVFSAVNRVIAEVLGASIRQEGTRISRRSFAPWQKDLRGMTEFIGCGEIEVWNLGRRTSELRPALAPHPILSVPEDQLARRIDPRDAYELARIADGFLGNRLLFELHGVEAIAECINSMYEGLDYTRQGHDAGRLDRVLRERLAQRAKRLPRRHQTV